MMEEYTVEYQKARTNLIFNPSFEDNQFFGSLVGCTGSVQTYSSTPSPASLGSRYLLVGSLNNSASNEYATPVNQSRVVAGKSYTASLYAQNANLFNANMRIVVRFYSVAGALLSTVNGVDTNTVGGGAAVRLFVGIVSAPVGAYYASIACQFQRTNGQLGFVARLDGFMLEELLDLPSYFDPNSDSTAFWLGQAYASPSAILTNEYVVMDDVQQISGFIGRQQLADTFEPSRMTISARYPTGYASPNSAFRVGSLVHINRVGNAYRMWTGRIRNVTVEWDKPYDTSTSNGVGDYITLECEGAFADWGRLQGNGLSVAASDLLTQISNVLSGTNLQYGTTYTASTAPLLGASTVDDSLANWLNTACATVGATIKDGSDNNIVGINGRDWVGNLPVEFSDTTNDNTHQVYDSIVFDSVSADFFTEVEVKTSSYGDVVVSTGTAPFRTYRVNTFSASAAQATDLANYLLGVFGENGFGISQISCKSEAQNSWSLDLGYGWWDIIGYATLVTFRGSTFRCTVLGSSFTATPESSTFTYYLADAALTPYLILDDAVNGILDTNKLGW